MSDRTIHDAIKNLSHRLNCSLTTVKGEFDLTFDIRHLDIVRYVLKLELESFELIGICELRAGTSDEPSYFSGNTSNQNIFSIVCKYKNHEYLPEFSIYENGVFSKLFYKRNVSIRSRDFKFSEFLRNRKEICYLEERVSNSSEISPAINCKKVNGLKELTIYFQAYSFELDLFEELMNLTKKLDTEYNIVQHNITPDA